MSNPTTREQDWADQLEAANELGHEARMERDAAMAAAAQTAALLSERDAQLAEALALVNAWPYTGAADLPALRPVLTRHLAAKNRRCACVERSCDCAENVLSGETLCRYCVMFGHLED